MMVHRGSVNLELRHARSYGRKGGYSNELKELFRQGILETRVYTGERGRGGEITKIRIASEKQAVKDLIEEKKRGFSSSP